MPTKKDEIQLALRCIAAWTDAVSQVLSSEDPARRIRIAEVRVGPIGGRAGAGCPPNNMAIRACWPTLLHEEGWIRVDELIGALGRIEDFARALEHGMDPIEPERLEGFVTAPEFVDIVSRAQQPGVPPPA